MSAHIQQDDLLVGYENGQSDAIAFGYAYGLYALELTAEVMVFQVWLERVAPQITKDGCEPIP